MGHALSVNFEVQGVSLIVQDKDMACWYASAQMVLDWKRRRQIGALATLPVQVDQETADLYKANDGLQNFQILPLAKRLGLVTVPPMSPTIDGLLRWLKQYGPLWTNGKRHIVVIAGLRGSAAKGVEVNVYDPWPGVGVGWRSLSGWYAGFDPCAFNASSRDAGREVEAVFLHAP